MSSSIPPFRIKATPLPPQNEGTGFYGQAFSDDPVEKKGGGVQAQPLTEAFDPTKNGPPGFQVQAFSHDPRAPLEGVRVQVLSNKPPVEGESGSPQAAEIQMDAVLLDDLSLSRLIRTKEGTIVRKEVELSHEQREIIGNFILELSSRLNLPPETVISSIDLNNLTARLSNEETRILELNDEMKKIREAVDQMVKPLSPWKLYHPLTRGPTNADTPLLLSQGSIETLTKLSSKEFSKLTNKSYNGSEDRIRAASQLIEQIEKQLSDLLKKKHKALNEAPLTAHQYGLTQDVKDISQVLQKVHALDRFAIYYALSQKPFKDEASLKSAQKELNQSLDAVRMILREKKAPAEETVIQRIQHWIGSWRGVKRNLPDLLKEEDNYAKDIALMQAPDRYTYELLSARIDSSIKKDNLELMIVNLVRELEYAKEERIQEISNQWMSHPSWLDIPPSVKQVLSSVDLENIYFSDASDEPRGPVTIDTEKGVATYSPNEEESLTLST